MTRKGHTVFISEYNAPEDFKCLIEVKTNTQLSHGAKNGSIDKIEKLFQFVLEWGQVVKYLNFKFLKQVWLIII